MLASPLFLSEYATERKYAGFRKFEGCLQRVNDYRKLTTKISFANIICGW